MRMDIDFSKYFGLLFEKELQEANEYRIQCMPKKIYKYVSLQTEKTCKKDNKRCNDIDNLNKLKFNALEQQSIWMSKFEHLNDPFEYKAMFIDRDKLFEKGWNIDFIEEYLDRMKLNYNIASFTENLVDNMPMWAHYTNNHQGFCLEYTVLNAKMLFPISYEADRFAVASMLVNIFSKIAPIEEGMIDDQDTDFQFYMWMISHFGLIKHETWRYENELRVLYPSLKVDEPGVLVNAIDLGLHLSAIYVGNQCSTSNQKKLVEISNKLKTPIHKMHLIEDDEKFKLSTYPL
ncbi:MAG: hypothetical protein CVU98_06100 [Firmicutes bacterium HGW-Firmicutes-3]|nr:MAG: hypothetical protein CVU98_06100 [Firmicutes bacterium HGW-Firmicutes-3]